MNIYLRSLSIFLSSLVDETSTEYAPAVPRCILQWIYQSEMVSRVPVNFISPVISCLGLQEDDATNIFVHCRDGRPAAGIGMVEDSVAI